MSYEIDHECLKDYVAVDAAKTFNKDGVVKLEGVLSEDVLQGLRGAVDVQLSEWKTSQTAYDFQALGEQMWRGEEKFSVNGARRFDMDFYHDIISKDPAARPLNDGPLLQSKPSGKFFYDAAGWRRFGAIRQAAMDTVLPEIAAILLGSEYINFWEDTTFVKTANTPQRTAFHQDKAYFQISGDKCCIFWIPLDPVTKENGAMEYIKGSHLWGKEFAPNVFLTQTPFPHSDVPKLPDIEANREDYDIALIEANPGDVIVHHVLTVHGAGGNVSAHDNRRAISFRYCGDDIRYWNRPGALRHAYQKDALQDGDPLYSSAYPRVFPRPYPSAKISDLYKD